MAKLVKNTKQLEKAMGELMKEALFDASKAVEEIVDEFLRQWYLDYTPVMYERTSQFLYSCVTSKVIRRGNSYQTKVYIDWKNMHHTKKIMQNGAEVTKPLTKSEEHLIVEYANQGIHGIEDSEEGQKPVKFWDDALSEMEQKDIIINAFYDYLKWKGYDVEYHQEGVYDF